MKFNGRFTLYYGKLMFAMEITGSYENLHFAMKKSMAAMK
jgi:hypothetical protein